jgi:hypothetical protein
VRKIFISDSLLNRSANTLLVIRIQVNKKSSIKPAG